jgi:hypothetical protein
MPPTVIGGGPTPPPDPDEPTLFRRSFMTQQGRHRHVLRSKQFRANKILMDRALKALEANDLDDYESLRRRALGTPQDDSMKEAEPTSHEIYLDVRRVWITGGLVAALFAVVGLVLFKSTAAAAATPYVSLLSGLAGIALGWMFTSAGRVSTPRAPTQSSTASQRQ